MWHHNQQEVSVRIRSNGNRGVVLEIGDVGYGVYWSKRRVRPAFEYWAGDGSWMFDVAWLTFFRQTYKVITVGERGVW